MVTRRPIWQKLFEMSGGGSLGKVEEVDKALPQSSSGQREPGNATPSPSSPSGWLHLQNWKLKTLLEEKNAEIERLKTLLTDTKNENGVLIEKMKRMEAELVSEVEASGDLIVELMAAKEEASGKNLKLLEKEMEVQLLRRSARRNEIENYLWTAGLKTSTIMQNQTDFVSEQKKVLHLFPDVLKIIIQNVRKDYNCCTRWSYLLTLLTACRPVCHSWKESVDLIMEQDSSHIDLCPRGVYLFHYKRDYTPSPLKLSYDKFDNFRWNVKLKTISLELQGNPNFTPIPTRHLMIETTNFRSTRERDSQKWNKYCRMVSRYLQVLGRQVWYLTVNFCGSVDQSRDPAIVYRLLSEWLPLFPNVKSLSLSTGLSGSSVQNEMAWVNYLGKGLVPKFRNLVTFQTSQYSPLTYQILNNNQHVKRIGFTNRLDEFPTAKFLEMDFPNLSVLNYKCYDLEDFEKFVKVTWRLEHLSVEYFSETILTTKQFFEGLNKFGRTLNSLTFNLNQEGWTDPEKREVKLNLPRLKRLQLCNHGWEPVPLDKILPSLELESLESFSMELSVSYSSASESDSEMDAFLEYVNEFGDKFDWMKFSKLRNLKVTAEVNGYEMGRPEIFEVRRANMPSVRFDGCEVTEFDIYFWNKL